MAISQISLVGDSLTVGTGPVGTAYSIAQGGSGCWAELVAERLSNISGIGPLVSSGIRGVWLNDLAAADDNEWSRSGSWTAVTSIDLFDKVTYGEGMYANGISNTVTYTRPSTYRSTVIGFAVYWVDYSSGGNWQYSIDSGTWTNMNQTITNNNGLKKFYVSTAVTSTIDFRAYNGSVGVGCLIVGIELFYHDPATVTNGGLIVHNLGTNGTRLNNLAASTSGDRLAFFDSVTLGTGSPITNSPNIGVIMMHINDVTLANTTTWANDLTTLYNRVSPLGPVGFISPWECNTAVYNQTQQTNYRTQTKTTAASLGAYVYDLYDAWSANGWTGNTAAQTVGLLIDNLHESQSGHLDIATRIYWFIRTQFLGLGTVPTAYPVTSKQADVTYTGSKPAVAYAASLPVVIE